MLPAFPLLIGCVPQAKALWQQQRLSLYSPTPTKNLVRKLPARSGSSPNKHTMEEISSFSALSPKRRPRKAGSSYLCIYTCIYKIYIPPPDTHIMFCVLLKTKQAKKSYSHFQFCVLCVENTHTLLTELDCNGISRLRFQDLSPCVEEGPPDLRALSWGPHFHRWPLCVTGDPSHSGPGCLLHSTRREWVLDLDSSVFGKCVCGWSW